MADLYRFPGVQRDVSSPAIELQLQQAFERGLTEGKRLGAEDAEQRLKQQAEQAARAAADAQLQSTVAELRQQFEQQLQQLEQQLQQHHQQQEQQLAQAIFELVSKLSELTLEAELSLQPAHLQQAINTLVPLLQVNEHISAIRLSPQDLAWWQQLQQTALGAVTLQADTKLAAGSAVFVGASQLHMADFRQRLNSLLPQVQQQLLGNNHDGA
ncbi:FliH/SctL family protein [Rheinheimera aquimaris]|jgi:flagellar biosynthesis/type III secretory pathway protein FliH|uniref:FliH/SctL family protein n=1 Tax=Rheinheimera aquimaris TaxID=412437 RepID=UPI0010668DB8|nr:FliH/SctL family protein [Rheinheimera aquimaris]MCD1599970.1 hypothetical protein [Rheinheimera aquimaris]